VELRAEKVENMIKDVRVGQTSWKYKRGGREDVNATRVGPQAVADGTLGIHSSCLSHQPDVA
jgi:hypothetical protein